MTDKIAVLSTCDSEEEARKLARELVEARLAACVNMFPGIRSVYRWKGAVEEAGEILLLVKTSRALLDEVRATIERLHSYELPEVIAFQIVDGSPDYLDWLANGLKAAEDVPEVR